jgi:hypothetical protein
VIRKGEKGEKEEGRRGERKRIIYVMLFLVV